MQTTDAVYNAQSRFLETRLLIYFNSIPTEITRDNYLLSWDILEDLGLAVDSPVQSLAANELSFDLLNEDRRFSPANTAGPFYGKITQGVRIVSQIRPVEGDYDWDELGTFSVTDWNISYDGMRASVTALNDAQKIITDSNEPSLPVVSEDTAGFLALLFGDTPYNVNGVLPSTRYLFPKTTRRETLNGILNAKRFVSTCDRLNVLQVSKLPFSLTPKILTDADQIIDIETPNAFITQYNDATVIYSLPRLLFSQSILSLASITLIEGLNVFDNALFSSRYVENIDYAKVDAIAATSFRLRAAASSQCSFDVTAIQADSAASIDLVGTILDLSSFTLPGTGRAVKVTNEYVQTAAEAAQYRSYLTTFVTCPNQTIKVKIRGNPHIKLGSLVVVNSSRYALNYTGVVIENSLSYSGGLNGYITLLNINAIGG